MTQAEQEEFQALIRQAIQELEALAPEEQQRVVERMVEYARRIQAEQAARAALAGEVEP